MNGRIVTGFAKRLKREQTVRVVDMPDLLTPEQAAEAEALRQQQAAAQQSDLDAGQAQPVLEALARIAALPDDPRQWSDTDRLRYQADSRTILLALPRVLREIRRRLPQ